jgi:protein phosphatase
VITIQIVGQSDRGEIREGNEDCFLIAGIVENQSPVRIELDSSSRFFFDYGVLVALADGMGGHRAGETASRTALDIVSKHLMASLKSGQTREIITQEIHDAIVSADRTLCELSAQHPSLSGMGSTLVGMLIRPEGYYIFHAGDSRLYRFRDGYLNQFTKDHSLVQELIDAGKMSVEDREAFARRNVITNSLGGGTVPRCRPEIRSDLLLVSDDCFLLCSDGLTECVPLAAIEEILREDKDTGAIVSELITSAKQRGAADNVTVIMVKLSELQSQ